MSTNTTTTDEAETVPLPDAREAPEQQSGDPATSARAQAPNDTASNDASTSDSSATPRQTAPAQPVPETQKPPLRFWLTLLELAAFGALGFVVVAGLSGLIVAGIGGLFALGLGVILLVGALYAIWGVAWFEIARVDGLYALGAPSLTWVRPRRPGFLGWLGTLPRQAIVGRMWAAFANFFIMSVLGTIMLAFAQAANSSIINMFWGGGSLLNLGGALICAAAIFGIVLLARVISLGIIRSGAREEELRAMADRADAEARTAGAQAEAAGAQAQAFGVQREGAVRAAALERERIERDLHDGVQPRLVSVGMTLGLAQEKIDTDPAAAKALVQEAHTSTKAAITELRQLARGIYASVLDDRGLDAALSGLAARSHVPVALDVRMDERAPKEAETAVYFAIAESLTNAAKHSRASEARVTVRLRSEDDDGRSLWARVEDNGAGGATITPGGGLDGIKNRVAAAGGSMNLVSPKGGPTALEVTIPCVS